MSAWKRLFNMVPRFFMSIPVKTSYNALNHSSGARCLNNGEYLQHNRLSVCPLLPGCECVVLLCPVCRGACHSQRRSDKQSLHTQITSSNYSMANGLPVIEFCWYSSARLWHVIVQFSHLSSEWLHPRENCLINTNYDWDSDVYPKRNHGISNVRLTVTTSVHHLFDFFINSKHVFQLGEPSQSSETTSSYWMLYLVFKCRLKVHVLLRRPRHWCLCTLFVSCLLPDSPAPLFLIACFISHFKQKSISPPKQHLKAAERCFCRSYFPPSLLLSMHGIQIISRASLCCCMEGMGVFDFGFPDNIRIGRIARHVRVFRCCSGWEQYFARETFICRRDYVLYIFHFEFSNRWGKTSAVWCCCYGVMDRSYQWTILRLRSDRAFCFDFLRVTICEGLGWNPASDVTPSGETTRYVCRLSCHSVTRDPSWHPHHRHGYH